MSELTLAPELKTLAKNLTTDVPRSPRDTLGGFVLAARMVDKCRATLAGTAGEYHYNCPLDKMVLSFAGLDAEALKAFVATGADDTAVDVWIRQHSEHLSREAIVQWNNSMRDKRLSDLPVDIQVYMEDYIPQFVPHGKVVYHWFDVYDIEEGRL